MLQEVQKEQNKEARCQLRHEQHESPIQHARQTLMPYPKQASTQAWAEFLRNCFSAEKILAKSTTCFAKSAKQNQSWSRWSPWRWLNLINVTYFPWFLPKVLAIWAKTAWILAKMGTLRQISVGSTHFGKVCSVAKPFCSFRRPVLPKSDLTENCGVIDFAGSAHAGSKVESSTQELLQS